MFLLKTVEDKRAGRTDVLGAAHYTCFKYLVSRTIFTAVQVNKKANYEEVLASS